VNGPTPARTVDAAHHAHEQHRCDDCPEGVASIRAPRDIGERLCARCAHRWLVIEAHDLLIRWQVPPGPDREQFAESLAEQLTGMATEWQRNA
jgi:hypothetical protein